MFWAFFFVQAEDGIRDLIVTGVQACALPVFVPAVANDTNEEYRDLLSAELEVLNAYAVKCVCDMHKDDNEVLSALELEEEERQKQKGAKSNQ